MHYDYDCDYDNDKKQDTKSVLQCSCTDNIPKNSFSKPIIFPVIANCGGILTGSSGTFTSPEWGSSPTYPAYQNCTWTKYCVAGIVLTVKSFDVEFQSSCE